MPSMTAERRMAASSVILNTHGISVERKIYARPESAWDILTDTSKWRMWGPSVTGVSCPDRYIRKDSTGRIRLPIGLLVPFRVTEYDRGSYWGWKVAGIRATGHRLIAQGERVCRIRFEMPAYWLSYVVVCKTALERIARLLEG